MPRFSKQCVLSIFAVALTVVFNVRAEAGVIVESFNGLSHGQIVSANSGYINPGTTTAQTTFNQFNGFSVSGINLQDGSYGNRDLIVSFDTFTFNSSDGDLEDPFDGGGNAARNNLSGQAAGTKWSDLQDTTVNPDDAERQKWSRFHNALIIQERGVGTDADNDGYIDNDNGNENDTIGPDDEGARPSGSISFDFDNSITSFGFDLLDVEGLGTGEEPGTVQFFDENGMQLAEVGFLEFLAGGDFQNVAAPVEFGNNSANRIIPISAAQLSDITGNTISSFDKVTVNLGGSGAIDNITYDSPSSTPVVPEPASIILWSVLGLVVLVDHRRRKRVPA